MRTVGQRQSMARKMGRKQRGKEMETYGARERNTKTDWEGLRHQERLGNKALLSGLVQQRPRARDTNPRQRDMERQTHTDRRETSFRKRRSWAWWGKARQDSFQTPGLDGWRYQ